MDKEKITEQFLKNTNYIINQTERNLKDGIKILTQEVYFERAKEQIENDFKELLTTMRNWERYFKQGDFDRINSEYKKIEGNVSELELCLADYKQIFNCDGIAYSLFEIGLILASLNRMKAKED